MSKFDEAVRYDRLVLGWGPENQQKVGNSYVNIGLDGFLGKYCASYLASAGFGNIRLLSDKPRSENYFWAFPLENKSQAVSYANALNMLNPNVNTIGIEASMDSPTISSLTTGSDILVDTSNNPRSKAWTLKTAMEYDIPAVSASCDDEYAQLVVYDPRRDNDRFKDPRERKKFLLLDYKDKTQDELVSLAWSGIVDTEIKKLLLGEGEPHEEMGYSFMQRSTMTNFLRKRALVIGAGASSNIANYSLGLMGFGQIDIIDYDTVGSSNFPRTPLLVNHYGELKSLILAENLNRIFPNSRFNGINSEFDSSFPDIKYDVVVDCVDNDATRGEVRDYSVNNSIPQLSIGTAFDGFTYALCVPYHTSCLRHTFDDFDELVRLSANERAEGCEETLPSNSWMQAGAAFAVNELGVLFEAEQGDLFPGYMIYNEGDIVSIDVDYCGEWEND